MADDKINKDNVTQAKEYLKTLIEAKDISRDITDFTKQLLKNYEGSSGQISAILSTYRDIGKAINDQSNSILQVLNNEKSTKDIIKDILKNQNLTNKLKSEELSLENERQSLLEEQLRLDEQANKAAAQGNMQLFDSYIKEETILKDKLELNKKILGTIQAQGEEIGYTIEANKIAKKLSEDADKKTKGFSSFEKIIKSIPLLKGLSEPFEKASSAARAAALAQKSSGEIFKAGASGIGDFLKGPIWITSLYKVAKFFLDAMFAADERVTNIAKNLSVSKDAAASIYSNLTNLKGTLETELGTTKNIVEAFNDLAGITEFTTIATDKQIDAQIILTKELGLSKEAALGLQESFAVSNIEATKGVDIVYDQVAAFARQNGLIADGRKILDQVNKTSKLIQLNFKGNIPLLTKTILEANKLGLSLEQVDKIAGSLLDFESSISAELEAELLTGRNINLERARLFALNNDIAGLTKEIANQGINAANFASMNRIQQEAIAKALGMSASELGDSLYKQELIDKVAGNQINKLKEEAKILKASNNARDVAKGLAKEQQAIALQNAITSGQTLEQAQRSITAQEKFNVALEQAQEIFSDLVTGGSLDTLANIVKGLADTFSSGTGLFSFFGDLSKNVKKQGIISSQKTVKELSSQTDLSNEEKNKLQRAKDFLKENNQPIAEDFISRPGQPIQKFRKDDVIIGGTSLSGGSDEEIKTLLKELIAQVKQGGNVYIDNRMAGTATALGTYKI